MTPERRREISFLLLLHVFGKKGIDLRKFRRDIGTQAEELGIPIEKYRELMRVIAACAFNEAIQVPALIPQAITNLPEEELHAIAERAIDARFDSGEFDALLPITSILRKRSPEEEEKRREGLFEEIVGINNMGISTEEMLTFFEEKLNRVIGLTITKMREAVAVAVERGSRV